MQEQPYRSALMRAFAGFCGAVSAAVHVLANPASTVLNDVRFAPESTEVRIDAMLPIPDVLPG